MQQCLFVLICDHGMEEPLADWLLEYADDMVFSSEPIDCHGIANEALSSREQVSGRQRKLMLQIQISMDKAQRLREALARAFPNAALRYWITSLAAAGQLEQGHWRSASEPEA